jgi:Kinesin motor domain
MLQQLVFVEGASDQLIPTAEALERCFEQAMSRRATAATYLNAESSRSHLICMLRMQRTDKITGTTVKSKLSFVDLAGSERVARSGAWEEKDRMDEARSINKSLSALGDVISALTTGDAPPTVGLNSCSQLLRAKLLHAYHVVVLWMCVKRCVAVFTVA